MDLDSSGTFFLGHSQCHLTAPCGKRVSKAHGTGRTDAMAYVMVDVEADGPIPGDYSMVCFGAVLVKEGVDQTFYGRLRPISDKWIPDALAVTTASRAR
jgi:hypothetical protein